MWPNDRFIKLCGIELPIIQAPNARSALSDMIVAVSQAGGLGRLQADALFEVAVGTIISDRPPHRSARALISACGSYLG